jgi:hypothetical protein
VGEALVGDHLVRWGDALEGGEVVVEIQVARELVGEMMVGGEVPGIAPEQHTIDQKNEVDVLSL